MWSQGISDSHKRRGRKKGEPGACRPDQVHTSPMGRSRAKDPLEEPALGRNAGGQPQTSSRGHDGERRVEVGPEDPGLAAASSALVADERQVLS